MGATKSVAPGHTPALPPVEHGLSPSPEDLKTLRHVCDTIPYTIFLVVAAEAAERFAYRSLTGPMREFKPDAQNEGSYPPENYIQNPFHGSRLPGALGKVGRFFSVMRN